MKQFRSFTVLLISSKFILINSANLNSNKQLFVHFKEVAGLEGDAVFMKNKLFQF